jgi:hypothetical protein
MRMTPAGRGSRPAMARSGSMFAATTTETRVESGNGKGKQIAQFTI